MINKKEIIQLKTNFTKIPNKLIQDKSISPNAIIVYIYLASQNESWDTSLEDIANHTSISYRTTQRAVKVLKAKGWLNTERIPYQSKLLYELKSNPV